MTQSYYASEAIVNAVAEYEYTPPEVLPPVEEWLDSETYEKLTSARHDLIEPIEFTYLWYQVTVEPDGQVTVTP